MILFCDPVLCSGIFVLDAAMYAAMESDSNVIVMGDDVNLRRPGIYRIKYLCRDAAGNEARPQQRIVVVTSGTNSPAVLSAQPVISIAGVFASDCVKRC